jgi:hypothetical protein
VSDDARVVPDSRDITVLLDKDELQQLSWVDVTGIYFQQRSDCAQVLNASFATPCAGLIENRDVAGDVDSPFAAAIGIRFHIT